MKHYAVIGNPVSHSLSPKVFNAAFKALKIPADYTAVCLNHQDLKIFFDEMKAGKWAGANVTMPLKREVLRVVDFPSHIVRVIGATNVVIKKTDGIYAENTDAAGFVAGLEKEAGVFVRGARVILLGAGGAAAAISYALCKDGISEVVIINRNPTQADQIIKMITKTFPYIEASQATWETLNDLASDGFDLIVNATPLGMIEHPWTDLGFINLCSDHTVIADAVTQPAKTALLDAAEIRGLKTVDGLAMFLHQAFLSFELMTGMKAPEEVMRDCIGLKAQG